MAMGLINAAATFQRMMDNITGDLPFVFSYLDDMLVYSRDIAEHKDHLHKLFEKLKEHGLAVSHSKCMLGVEELTFLGFRVNQQGITPLQDRVKAVQDFPKPDGPKAVQRFLGKITILGDSCQTWPRQSDHWRSSWPM